MSKEIWVQKMQSSVAFAAILMEQVNILPKQKEGEKHPP